MYVLRIYIYIMYGGRGGEAMREFDDDILAIKTTVDF